MTFENLNLIEPILKALRQEGYEKPTPIQAEAIPIVLSGKDLLGCAQTGTGKTAAFSIPIIQHLYQNGRQQGRRSIKALVLTPTRELAIQIGESFEAYGRYTGVSHTVIFGGVSQVPQTDTLKRGVDVLIATPGRLLDLIGQGFIDLKTLEYFVLDEADRMLDMGFIHDIKRILPLLPQKRQSLFFSATMPSEIARLADTILCKPEKVEVTPPASTVDRIEQSVYFVEKADKKDLLVELLNSPEITSALVFSRTKYGADKIARFLNKAGILADAIHGEKSQNARQRALSNFKEHKIKVLVATDIAARGIDVDELSHVFNNDLPEVSETYVHRIGRTGRAGRDGVAVSFCSTEEVPLLKDIQKLIGKTIPVAEGYAFPASVMPEATKQGASSRQSGNRKSSNNRKPAPSGNNQKVTESDNRRSSSSESRKPAASDSRRKMTGTDSRKSASDNRRTAVADSQKPVSDTRTAASDRRKPVLNKRKATDGRNGEGSEEKRGETQEKSAGGKFRWWWNRG